MEYIGFFVMAAIIGSFVACFFVNLSKTLAWGIGVIVALGIVSLAFVRPVPVPDPRPDVPLAEAVAETAAEIDRSLAPITGWLWRWREEEQMPRWRAYIAESGCDARLALEDGNCRAALAWVRDHQADVAGRRAAAMYPDYEPGSRTEHVWTLWHALAAMPVIVLYVLPLACMVVAVPIIGLSCLLNRNRNKRASQ